MVRKAFGYPKEAHYLAVLKRGVTIIQGKRALYVRFPGEGDDVPIFRFNAEDIRSDWLTDPGNKWALAAFMHDAAKKEV